MSGRCQAVLTPVGRRGLHKCGNRAKPGTDLCGVHTPRVAPEPAGPTTPPVVHTHERTTRTLTLSWPEGEGPRFPRFPVPSTSQVVCWERLTVTADVSQGLSESDTVFGHGRNVKHDGSLGAVANAGESGMRLGRVPVGDDLRAAWEADR